MKRKYSCLIDNKPIDEEITVIGKMSEGWSRPDIVSVEYGNEKFLGFLKSTSVLEEKNGIEVVLGQIGKLLDVPMANTISVFSDETYRNMSAIVSLSVVQNSKYRFVSFREMRDELFYDLKKGDILMYPWLERWLAIRSRKNGLPVDMWEVEAICERDYFDTIQFATEISKLYARKYNLLLRDFETSYTKMLLFDILTGQADRSPSNYGLIIDDALSEIRFSPLFDNSTLTKPHISKEQVSINQVLLNRDKLIEVVYMMVGEAALDFRNIIINQQRNIYRIIENDTNHLTWKAKEMLLSSVKKGITVLERIN